MYLFHEEWLKKSISFCVKIPPPDQLTDSNSPNPSIWMLTLSNCNSNHSKECFTSSNSGSPCVLRAAHMVSQGAPKLPDWC